MSAALSNADAIAATLAEAIARHAHETPSRPALVLGDETLDYARLSARIDRAVGALRADGVTTGERVAYLGFNHADQIVLLAALMRLSAILVPLNYRLAKPELAAIVAHAGVRLLLFDAAFAASIEGLDVVVRSREAWSASLGNAEPNGGQTQHREGFPDAPALLVYTSGTTGRPKGALHSQRGITANARASIAMHAMSADDVVLTVLPMFHVGGLNIQTVPALFAGATVILHPRFDAGDWLHAVATRRPTLSLLVPATMRAVIEHREWQRTDLRSLRILGTGSSTIPHSLIEAFHARGVPVCQIYGATETGPVSIVQTRDEAFTHVGAAGRPARDVDIRLVDDGGHHVGTGAIGEILVRAPHVMCGYWREPLHPSLVDGWFSTGDLARRDADGFYTIVGRREDLIISGGENIHASELESVLASSPDIAECAVVGLPDRTWGEAPVAVIVARDGARLDEEQVRALFDGRLARYKHPRRIVFRASLPKNALGKIQKRVLIEELAHDST